LVAHPMTDVLFNAFFPCLKWGVLTKEEITRLILVTGSVKEYQRMVYMLNIFYRLGNSIVG
jgi:hypothetical protein